MERTVSILKPDAVASKTSGAILQYLESIGFKVLKLQNTTLTRDQAEIFYAEHKGKDFYPSLIEHMISGPSVLLVLARENAVWQLRQEIKQLRDNYSQGGPKNVIHGSDSPEAARREEMQLFSEIWA